MLLFYIFYKNMSILLLFFVKYVYDHFTNGMLKGNAQRFLEILGDTGFVRAFYEVIKEYLEISDPPLERFFATGVAPVTLDSLTSGFNIATKLTNNPLFIAMCGLTEDEVKQAIELAGIKKEEQEETFLLFVTIATVSQYFLALFKHFKFPHRIPPQIILYHHFFCILSLYFYNL